MTIKQGRPTKTQLKKQIVFMVEGLGKNFTEIAKELDMSKQNVKHHYDTGKKLSTENAVDQSKLK